MSSTFMEPLCGTLAHPTGKAFRQNLVKSSWLLKQTLKSCNSENSDPLKFPPDRETE